MVKGTNECVYRSEIKYETYIELKFICDIEVKYICEIEVKLLWVIEVIYMVRKVFEDRLKFKEDTE